MSPGGGETDLNATSQESVWAAFHCACVRACVCVLGTCLKMTKRNHRILDVQKETKRWGELFIRSPPRAFKIRRKARLKEEEG